MPSPLKRIDTATGSTSGITVGATAGSGGSPIVVQCKYKFDNKDPNDPVTGSCMDDSMDTPGLNGPEPGQFQFDSHKPEHLDLVSDGVDNPSFNNGTYHDDRDFEYQLHDDGGKVMGWVYIVERFDSAQAWNQAASQWPLSPTGTIVDSFWINTPDQGAFWSFMHYYFAATTDTGINGAGRSGILVQTTRSKVGTLTISNGEQP